MRIAIVGTGIAGNVAAYRLRDEHQVTVFEAADRIGGHSNTIDVHEGRNEFAVDTGFIVFNDRTYPNFLRLLDETGQASQESEMSFSVQREDGSLEYKGSSLNSLFAQRRNLLSASFHRMLRDILRFNRAAPRALDCEPGEQTVGGYIDKHSFSEQFYDDYLAPMAAAIWSAEPASVRDMPLSFLLRFFMNHGLLALRNRPRWRVIKGGSRAYVEKLVAGHRDRIRLGSAVQRIRRLANGVELQTAEAGVEQFDAVFVACHSDEALALLDDASPQERAVLGSIRYQSNEAVLHTDTSILPSRRRAWAAWNHHLPSDRRDRVAVTYNMNILQRLHSKKTYCVTLNNDSRISEHSVIRRIQYAHPVFSSEAVAAQRCQADLNADRTYFCGAYWRNGFHEDGVVSAMSAVDSFRKVCRSGQLHLRRAG